MKIPSQQLADLGFTYRQIAEVILYILDLESESLEDFLIDFNLYTSTDTYRFNSFGIGLNWMYMESHSNEFSQIMEIARALTIDSHSSMRISDFLQETFNRFSQSRNTNLSAESPQTN